MITKFANFVINILYSCFFVNRILAGYKYYTNLSVVSPGHEQEKRPRRSVFSFCDNQAYSLCL